MIGLFATFNLFISNIDKIIYVSTLSCVYIKWLFFQIYASKNIKSHILGVG
jgi:hypothetical protein